jgi:hypothetical protein
MWMPEMTRAMTGRWISEVLSKIVSFIVSGLASEESVVCRKPVVRTVRANARQRR